jgi:hypothetical protein
VNPQHQTETVSIASVQTFEDVEGGVPLDSPLAQARQQQQHGRPATQRPTPSENDEPNEGENAAGPNA